MRLFVSLPVPDALIAPLASAVDHLKRRIPGGRWVAPEQRHFTLKFLGEVGEDRLPAVLEALGLAAGVPAFHVALQGLGAFPDEAAARVVWAGVAEGAPEMEALARGIDRRLAERGFPPEVRPFRAHLTLARFKSPPPRTPIFPATLAGAEFGRFKAEAAHLMESRLGAEGARHLLLRAFPLEAA